MLGLVRPYRARVAGVALRSVAEVGLRALSPWPPQGGGQSRGNDHRAGLVAPHAADALVADERVHAGASVLLVGLVVPLTYQPVLMRTRVHARIGQSMVYALTARLFSPSRASRWRTTIAPEG